jgi:ribosomal protein S18 acetylase RimI-like enzyme
MSEVHSTGAPYKNKWELSSITFCGDEVVSFLTAWERGVSEAHPLDSIYLHRLAVRPDHQSNGVARHILRNTITGFAQEIPEVSTYTLQTNDVESNKKALDFYESLGFERLMPVYYPDKLDVLMKLSREAVLASMATNPDATVSSP